MINDRRIGYLEIQRTEPLTDPAAPSGEVHTYTVELDGDRLGTVEHRYSDGPWALIKTALTLYKGQHV
jgi:hypothetical protein